MAVVVIFKDVRTCIAARGNVIDSTGEFYAQWASQNNRGTIAWKTYISRPDPGDFSVIEKDQ